MNRRGQARRDLIVGLVPPDRHVIDVGADHGHIAAELGAVATERMPHRRGRRDVPWVVADGLAPFRQVDVAIIAGMGSKTIEGILSIGPRPTLAIVHAPDDPQRLRTWLGANGWRIDAEGLAPEGNRFAEVIRVVQGTEPATGLRLAYGPLLLDSNDPHLAAHLTHHRDYHRSIADKLADHAPDVAARSEERARFLEDALQKLW